MPREVRRLISTEDHRLYFTAIIFYLVWNFDHCYYTGNIVDILKALEDE